MSYPDSYILYSKKSHCLKISANLCVKNIQVIKLAFFIKKIK